MNKKLQLGLILFITLATFYAISSFPLGNADLLKWSLALPYIALSSYLIHTLIKEQRRLPFILKSHLILSSLSYLVFLYFTPSVSSLGMFLTINFMAIYSWYNCSYKKLANSNISLGRYKIPLKVYVANFRHKECRIINISESGCLVSIEDDLKKGNEYKLEIQYNNKILPLRAKVVRIASKNQYGFRFLNMDQRHYQSMEEFLEHINKNASFYSSKAA